jgi:hypothetical protein
MMNILKSLGIVAALLPATAGLAGDPTLPAFDAAAFANGMANPYFPLDAGKVSTLKGTIIGDDGAPGPFTFVRTILGQGPVVMGVQTVAIQDDEYEGALLTERSVDYYATDAAGAVWYFGEDVTVYAYDAAGALTGTSGGATWRAGTDGAEPGIALRAVPVTEPPMFRAHAPKAKEMEFSVAETGLTPMTVPAGTYADVLRIYTESTADADLREYTYWAKGTGLIAMAEDLSAAKDAPKVSAELVP